MKKYFAGALGACILLGTPIAAEEHNQHRPVFSPDGNRMIFMLNSPETNGDWELFLVNTDGSSLKRLTNRTGWDGYAVWSPDGSHIVFDRETGPDNPAKQPVMMDLKNGATNPLGIYPGWLSINDWYGDTLLAFWEKDGQRDLYLLDMNGGIVNQLTDTPNISEHDAHFSPDGKTVAFASGPSENTSGDNSETRLETLQLDTAVRTMLRKSAGRLYGIDWSPDGKQIAYTDAPGGQDDDADVFVYDFASKVTTACTQNSAWDHMPVWAPNSISPDSISIVFTSYRTGEERLYVTNCNGSTRRLWASDSED